MISISPHAECRCCDCLCSVLRWGRSKIHRHCLVIAAFAHGRAAPRWIPLYCIASIVPWYRMIFFQGLIHFQLLPRGRPPPDGFPSIAKASIAPLLPRGSTASIVPQYGIILSYLKPKYISSLCPGAGAPSWIPLYCSHVP